ncbi:MAG: hypothetical protein Q7S87_06850 [Agitococcus sp.]|nr:hypothetical protein [Agitococcus sp.]MDO9179963.1 hypothetical protein [Agitococcus sp.]
MISPLSALPTTTSIAEKSEATFESIDVLKNSEQWQAEKGVLVTDPDGWDRANFDASWAELICQSEFERRLGKSTALRFPTKFPSAPSSASGEITGVQMLESGYAVQLIFKGELPEALRTLGTRVRLAVIPGLNTKIFP